MKNQSVIGFLFALTAVMLWASLPLALQPVLQAMDATTIVWFRFVAAAIGTFFILLLTNKMPMLKSFSRAECGLLLLGAVGLAGNFLLFNLSLRYIPAAVSQILSPLGSFAMLTCGVLIFKERIRWHQKIGFAVVMLGFGLFFNDRFDDFIAVNLFTVGLLMGIAATFIWLCYGVVQKILSARFQSLQILLPIYALCAMFFMPYAEISALERLSTEQLICLAYCCLNTIVAYGCYAEALRRWTVSNVSLMMTQIPVMTMIFTQLLFMLAPHLFMPLDLNWVSYIGAAIVVFGAVFAVIGHRWLYKQQLKPN